MDTVPRLNYGTYVQLSEANKIESLEKKNIELHLVKKDSNNSQGNLLIQNSSVWDKYARTYLEDQAGSSKDYGLRCS